MGAEAVFSCIYGYIAIMTWILVFWLQVQTNFAVYEQHATERACREREQLWQRRFDMVKSQLRAECRSVSND